MGVGGRGLGARGFGFRVPGFGLRVPGLGFRVSGFRCRAPGFGLRVPGSGFRGYRAGDELDHEAGDRPHVQRERPPRLISSSGSGSVWEWGLGSIFQEVGFETGSGLGFGDQQSRRSR